MALSLCECELSINHLSDHKFHFEFKFMLPQYYRHLYICMNASCGGRADDRGEAIHSHSKSLHMFRFTPPDGMKYAKNELRFFIRCHYSIGICEKISLIDKYLLVGKEWTKPTLNASHDYENFLRAVIRSKVYAKHFSEKTLFMFCSFASYFRFSIHLCTSS